MIKRGESVFDKLNAYSSVAHSPMHLSCFAFTRKKGFSHRGKLYPSIKIASSRALSSWNCRSISVPSSWKSGTLSSAGAQYPGTNSVSRYFFFSFYLLFSRIRSRARVFIYLLRNYARVLFEIARVRGTWQRVICFVTRTLARSLYVAYVAYMVQKSKEYYFKTLYGVKA